MQLKYHKPTDSLGVFFCDEVPSPLFQEDYTQDVRLLSDKEYRYVGLSILEVSTKLRKSEIPVGREMEVLLWIYENYPSLLNLKLNKEAILKHHPNLKLSKKTILKH